MTRTSILAVSAIAALSSSCLISTDALAFGHGFGGHFFAGPPVAPHPVAAFSAKRPSFAATRFSNGQIHQANSGNSSHLRTGSGYHKVKGSGSHTGTDSAVPASGCGVACKQAGAGGGLNGGKNTNGSNNPNGSNDPNSGNNNKGGGTTATGTGGTATANGGSSIVNIEGGGSGGGAGDVIGQVASALSGIGQAQAAPAQQVAAAPVQQAVTHVAVQRVVAESIGFRAIALGWNNSGAWVVRASPTLASAGADAMQTCNSQFGQCTLSEAQVAPTSFGCLVVVQSDDASHLFAAAGNSSDTALEAAAAQITNAGLHGQIVYSGCNS